MGATLPSLPAETARVASDDKTYTHIVVYTKSALAEQTTPTINHAITGEAHSASNVKFVDKDLDENAYGGMV